MKRMNSLIAVLVIAAITVLVPSGNAAVKRTVKRRRNVAVAPAVHLVAGGSSAMFNGMAVAAYNDLAAHLCVAGILQAPEVNAGDTCTLSHWSNKQANAAAWCNDTRLNSNGVAPTDQYGNVWVVWVEDTTVGNAGVTDLWADISLDSGVGVRCYLAGDTLNFAALATDNKNFPVNQVAASNFNGAVGDSLLDANALAAVNGLQFTAGLTDIRPEDALQAAYRILGNGAMYNAPSAPATGLPGDTYASTVTSYGTPNWAIYSFALGYSAYNTPGGGPPTSEKVNGIGTPIFSGEPGSPNFSQPVIFALPGSHDPLSGNLVPPTIQVFPIGEAPIIFVANRTNIATGLGQPIATYVAGNGNCYGAGLTICQPDNTGQPAGYVSDGSYYARNVFDQHPWPSVPGTFPSLNTVSGNGACLSGGSGVGLPECHVTRRPLGNLFTGGDCEGDSSAFTWPIDPTSQGLRAQVPNRQVFPITLFLREPVSGTYNTTEYTEMRRYGQSGSNYGSGALGTQPFERPAYVSQETNVLLGPPSEPEAPFGPPFYETAANSNGLFQTCAPDFGEAAPFTNPPANEGIRIRGIGTGEVTNGNANVAQNGVLNTPDSITYTFFSFGNVNKMANLGVKFGYLMIDGIDPLFDNYQNAAQDAAGGAFAAGTQIEGEPAGSPGVPLTHNPGQVATNAAPLSWGELPVCGGGGQPPCNAAAIWGANPTYPHIRDGSYPSWSELRLLCDTANAHCLVGGDALGAEGLIQNLQFDVHNSNVGGVPDLLPFADGGVATWAGQNGPYGDALYIRDHYAYVQASDACLKNAGAFDQNGNPCGAAFQFPTTSPTSIHESNVLVTYSCNGGAPQNAPPTGECGGDAGGAIILAPNPAVVVPGTGNQQ